MPPGRSTRARSGGISIVGLIVALALVCGIGLGLVAAPGGMTLSASMRHSSRQQLKLMFLAQQLKLRLLTSLRPGALQSLLHWARNMEMVVFQRMLLPLFPQLQRLAQQGAAQALGRLVVEGVVVTTVVHKVGELWRWLYPGVDNFFKGRVNVRLNMLQPMRTVGGEHTVQADT